MWGVALALLACAAAGAAPICRAQAPEEGLRLLEAVEMTLAHDPNIDLVRNQVDVSRGVLVSTAGEFDPVIGVDLTRDETEGPDGDGRGEVAILGTVGLFQQLRTGLSLEPAVALLRTDDGAAPADNSATVSFALRQPLLRGRGRAVVTAAERSAAQELDASRLDVEHAVSTRLAVVISQYWRVAAAVLDLEVLRITEESSRDLLATTRRLIAADVTPAAEAVQLEADLAAREASRIAGKQVLFAARQALGREIGLTPEEIAALPLPSDPFPRIESETVPDAATAGLRYAREALARRADLQAARERLEASEAFLVAAQNALEPQLDLLFVPSYTGRAEGDAPEDFVSPIVENVPGVSTLVGLSFSWPVGDHRAEGVLIQTEAAVDRAELELERLAKTIGAETPAALDAVGKAALQLDRAAEALRLFEEAVENEEKKLQAGSSTLIDLISQRDRLIAAQRLWVQAQLELALALVELRFQTGTLVTSTGEAGTLVVEDVVTIPGLDRL